MRPDEYIDVARTWIKTPFRHQGRTKQVAADCIGVVYGAAIELGLTDTTLPIYAKSPHAGQLEAGLRACRELACVLIPAPGDILVFRFARDLQHVGIYTGRNIIHAYQPLGECVEHRFCQKWKARQLLAFRFRDFYE